MTTDPYSAPVREYFANPGHVGDLDDGVRVFEEGQGVRVSLAVLAADSSISQLRFRAWGCPHVIAAAEAFCVSYEGRPLRDLQMFSVAELMQSLSVPAQKTGRILVLEDAVRSLWQEMSAAGRADTRD